MGWSINLTWYHWNRRAAVRKVPSLAASFSSPAVAAHIDARIECQSQRFRARWSDAPEEISQKSLDGVVAAARQVDLTESASEDLDRARLNAAFDSTSGKWLYAIPSPSIGTMLDNNTLRIAAGLRLGLTVCAPHACTRCATPVTPLGHHGLSCSRSVGRHPRHRALNEVISRAFRSAGIASQLEPTGLSRSSALRPDGMTLTSWTAGRPLVWDATVWDTLAPSHLSLSARAAGGVAKLAERSKSSKYRELENRYVVQPVAIETLGVMGPSTDSFLRDLGRRIELASGDSRATSFLLQRVSVEIQRGNAAAVNGSLPAGDDLPGIG